MDMSWEEHQKWEAEWHGLCLNSYREETKQMVYAKRMGLEAQRINWQYPAYDLKGISVLDIGGGPYSMLLKCVNFKEAFIIDPNTYPEWVMDRYKAALINYVKAKAEDLLKLDKIDRIGFGIASHFPVVDEVWIYNCLQHVEDPEMIVRSAMTIGKKVRIFEWLDTKPTPGHPTTLTQADLDNWLEGIGQVEDIKESGADGRAYYGVFGGLEST